MLETQRFPNYVTDSSDQSRTLGAQLDRTMAGKSPSELMCDSIAFQELIIELWHNLPCLTDESVLLCLPFYFNINGTNSSYTCSSSVPPVWQLNEDYASRLWSVGMRGNDSMRLLQLLSQEEKQMLVDLCKIFESEIEESFEPVLKLIETA